jgi:hypothetical protein
MQYRLDDYARRHHLVPVLSRTYINKPIIAKFVMDNRHATTVLGSRRSERLCYRQSILFGSAYIG